MNMYRVIICGLMVLAAAFTAVGGDMPFGYRSHGTDTYASGEPVRDGECYSFVWVRNGRDFAGYNRDGSLVDAANNVQVHARALAIGGKCPPVNFLVPEEFAATHADGSYRVIVLDTRRADGLPAGLDESGRLWRVNGWGVANVRRQTTLRLAMSASTAASGETTSGGSTIEQEAKMPAGCRQPVITGLSFDEAGNAVVEFAQSERYLSYRLGAGETPTRVGEVVGQESRDGSGTGEKVKLTLRRDEFRNPSAAFMRVEAVTELQGTRK